MEALVPGRFQIDQQTFCKKVGIGQMGFSYSFK